MIYLVFYIYIYIYMKKRGVKINMSKKKNGFNNDIIEEFVSEKWVPIKYNGKETKLPDNNTTRSYIKYRIRIKNRSSVKC